MPKTSERHGETCVLPGKLLKLTISKKKKSDKQALSKRIADIEERLRKLENLIEWELIPELKQHLATFAAFRDNVALMANMVSDTSDTVDNNLALIIDLEEKNRDKTSDE